MPRRRYLEMTNYFYIHFNSKKKMAVMNFGGVDENVVTREEFPLEKAREVLKDETIAVIGYGVQGPGQSLNLRDNGFNVIVGQRKVVRLGKKPLLTVGCPVKHCSILKKHAKKQLSSSICFQTLPRLKFGRVSKSI